MDKIRAGLGEGMKAVPRLDPQEIATHLRAFGDAFRSDKFDAKALTAASGANAHLVGWGAAHLAHFVETVSPVLTPDQRTKLAQRLREHAAHDPSAAGKPMSLVQPDASASRDGLRRQPRRGGRSHRGMRRGGRGRYPAGYYDDYPPDAYIATTEPVYFEGRAAYWYGGRWYYRDGGRWGHYDREPPALYQRRMQAPPVRRTYEEPWRGRPPGRSNEHPAGRSGGSSLNRGRLDQFVRTFPERRTPARRSSSGPRR